MDGPLGCFQLGTLLALSVFEWDCGSQGMGPAIAGVFESGGRTTLAFLKYLGVMAGVGGQAKYQGDGRGHESLRTSCFFRLVSGQVVSER